jgi:hypothetical protein
VKRIDFIKPADEPRYGRRMSFEEDLDFRSFLNSSDWVETERAFMLDPKSEAAGEPTLAAQGDYQSDVAPLRFGRVLTRAETVTAEEPLILMPAPNVKPVRLATQGGWRRREGFPEARGWLFRRGPSDGWQVSLRPSAIGYAIYLRTRATHAGHGLRAPATPRGALDGLHRDHPKNHPAYGHEHDYVLVDAGEDAASSYVVELLIAPELGAAKRLAVKAAYRDLHLPQVHAPPSSFRWLRIRPTAEVVFGDASVTI